MFQSRRVVLSDINVMIKSRFHVLDFLFRVLSKVKNAEFAGFVNLEFPLSAHLLLLIFS